MLYDNNIPQHETKEFLDALQNTPLQKNIETEIVNSDALHNAQQPVFSFKLRGAYNMIANLPQEQLDKGIITASAGNHAQGWECGWVWVGR